MYISELSTGNKIRFKLISGHFAYPELQNNSLVYKTSNISKQESGFYLTEGEGTILSNNNKVISVQFNSFDSRSCHGVAELDYVAFQNIYLYEGETNSETVLPKKIIDFNLEQDLEFPHTAPAMNIYRKKITLFWSE